MAVLDASAALELLLKTPRGLRNLAHLEDDLHAPHLLDIEFVQGLRRMTLMGGVAPERALLALGMFTELVLTRHLHEDLLTRVWSLRSSLSAYDASYVALAEALGTPLLTCDARLSRSHGHQAKILLLT